MAVDLHTSCKLCSFKGTHAADLKIHQLLSCTHETSARLKAVEKQTKTLKPKNIAGGNRHGNTKKSSFENEMNAGKAVSKVCKENGKKASVAIKQKQQQSGNKLGKQKTDKKYQCKVCSFKTKLKHSLKMHMAIHNNVMLICDVCGFETVHRGNLVTHIRAHTNIKPFICKLCDFRTFYSNNLKTHITTHSLHKAHECSKCLFSSHRLRVLKYHQLHHCKARQVRNADEILSSKLDRNNRETLSSQIHQGKHPVLRNCPQCSYKTPFTGALKRHIMTHTGEKPFACNKCNYRTTRKSHLKLHNMIHLDVKPFSCALCDYKCRSKSDLKAHHGRHHST